MNKIFTVLIGFVLSTSAWAGWVYGNMKVSRFKYIYDGDTFYVDIDEWPRIIGKNMPVRVKGIDAPEIDGKCDKEVFLARKATARLEKILLNAKTIELRRIERGKYFRILAEVYVDGQNVADLMLKSGFVRPYRGGKRKPWC
ncbi:MAG: thermonuclease family protein [Chloroflexi bacterium]|nr:MAG: thermonuclease family protein [Chloroflexota bacterium]